MISATKKYYRKGPLNQKNSNIAFSIRRAKQKDIMKWTPEQKTLALYFIEDCEAKFQIFKKDLIDILNQI